MYIVLICFMQNTRGAQHCNDEKNPPNLGRYIMKNITLYFTSSQLLLSGGLLNSSVNVITFQVETAYTSTQPLGLLGAV